MHTKSKLQKTLTRWFKFKFRPSFDFITITQTLPFLKVIRDPESICVYLEVLVWNASDICLYPLSEKVTRGLAYHQTSHKRQVRMSVPPGSSPVFGGKRVNFQEREFPVSPGAEKNYQAEHIGVQLLP